MTLRNTCAPSRKGKSQLVKYSCDHDYVLKWSTASPNNYNYYICIRYLHIMFGFFTVIIHVQSLFGQLYVSVRRDIHSSWKNGAP